VFRTGGNKVSADTPIGTARIEVEVDTSQFDSAIAAAKRSVTDMSTSAQQQYQQLAGAEKRRVDAMIRQADIIGMNRAQQLAYAASLRTSGPLLDEITKKLAKNQTAAQGAATEINKYGVSLKQQAAAMRGVPAQMTDIVVGLQGGQNPLTVLLQQGGQLKDMFGGVVPAASALAAQLSALINPVTLAAAAATGLGAAWYSASNEAAAFEKALAIVGTRVNANTAELISYADQIARLDGISEGRAAEALAQVAMTGQFAADELRKVAQAALLWEQAGVSSADEVIQAFVRIKKDPIAALKELEVQTDVVTDAQRRQIESLADQGRQTDAAKLLFGAYADTINARTPEILDSASAIEGGWRRVKIIFADLWDLAKEPFRADGIDDMRKDLEAAQDNLRRWDRQTSGGTYGSHFQRSEYQRAKQQADEALRTLQSNIGVTLIEANSATTKARGEWTALTATWDKAAQTRAKLTEIEEKGKAANQTTAQIKAAQDAYLASQEAKTTAVQRHAATAKKALSDEERAAKAVQLTYQSLADGLAKSIALQGDTTQVGRIRYEIEKGSLASLSDTQKEDLLNLAAVKDALDDYAAIYGDTMDGVTARTDEVGDGITEMTRQAARNMQSAFADYLFDPFDKGLGGMLEGFAKTLQRMAAEAASAQIFDSLGNWASGYTGQGAGWVNAIGGILTNAKPNAKGGVYDSPSLSAYSGGVYNSPQLFAFAKGAGVFGEAGPEAIMPLRRGSDGRLGVSASGSGTGLQVIVNNNAPAKVSTREQQGTGPNGESVRQLIIEVVSDDLVNGGKTAQAGQSRYDWPMRV